MKKINLVIVYGVLFTLIASNCLNAQDGKDLSKTVFPVPELSKSSAGSLNNGKAENDSTELSDNKLKADLKEAKISRKITGYVSNHFKDISGLKIYSNTDGSFLALFIMQKRPARVMYDKNGNWKYTIINCQEVDLPQNVKDLLNNNYIGYSISLVQEISQGELSFYKVYLENCKSFKQVLVSGDEIIIYNEFEK